MSTLTRNLAEFVVATRATPLTPRATGIVTDGFIDCIGVMLAGRAEPVVQVLDRLYGATPGPATLLCGERRADAARAALINGAAAHALDYDDVAFTSHPSTVLVPAIQAEAEALGLTGPVLLAAYQAGFEVWAELIYREPDPHFTKGWHPTAVFGTIAATAAIACLHGLDVERTITALGLAASSAGGVIANFGTMAKPWHAGKAAAAGIECVRLAMAGMSATDDGIGHANGFLAAISPRGRVRLDPATPELGRWLEREGICFKKYPLCYATHRVVDGAAELAKRQIDWNAIERVDIELGAVQYRILKKHLPRDPLEAKFSIEFALASGLRYGTAELRHLDPAIVTDPAMVALMQKVRVHEIEGEGDIMPGFAPADRVRLVLRDGRVEDSGARTVPSGHPRAPASRAELRAKYLDCCDYGGVERERAEAIYRALLGLGTPAT